MRRATIAVLAGLISGMASGAVPATAASYKNGLHCPGHWSAEKWTHSVSASGTARNTVTISGGGC